MAETPFPDPGGPKAIVGDQGSPPAGQRWASEARVKTGDPSRYLVALCKHFRHRARMLPGVEAHVEWSDHQGLASFGWGRCGLRAELGVLTLRAEAADEENLQRVELLVSDHLERFGKRDHLMVIWGPADDGSDRLVDSPQASDSHSLEHPDNKGEPHD